MERKYEVFLGTGVLIAGIVILLFVFSMMLPIAQNPGKFLREQMPEDEEQAQPPQCSFYWNSNELNVGFTDSSTTGSASITSYSWDFGDGGTSVQPNPTHTYSDSRDYNVRLTVRDGNGLSASSMTTVYPDAMGQNSGSSQSDGDMGDFGFSMDFTPFAIAALVSIAYIVLYLIGASILKAGWNLITPKAETISVRVKPKHLQLEPVETPANRPPTPQQYYPAQQQPPIQGYQQPPTQ
ncbi:MAG: PKD domain-containing protein [Methanobacteriota archaeon]